MRRALTTFVPALVWLAGVSVALLVPFPGELPMVVQAIPPWLERHGDKAVHAALFFVAAWLLARWFRRLPRVRRPLVAAVAVATLWGVGLELAQLRVPSRDGSLDGASHDDLSDGYERISRFHLGSLAYLAKKLDAMPEGDGTVLDHSCLLFLSNMWSGWKHDNMKLPVVTAGGMGGRLKTGRTLDYLYAGDDERKVCSLYLSLMDRMGVKLDRFGDADTRLADL
jgi:hypothetical protein